MTLSTASPKVGTVPLAAGEHQVAAPPRHPVQNALLAGLGEADVRPASESDVAGAAVHDDALRPGLGEVAAGGAPDEQGQSSGAASVPVAAGFPDGCDEAGGESVGSAGHGVMGGDRVISISLYA